MAVSPSQMENGVFTFAATNVDGTARIESLSVDTETKVDKDNGADKEKYRVVARLTLSVEVKNIDTFDNITGVAIRNNSAMAGSLAGSALLDIKCDSNDFWAAATWYLLSESITAAGSEGSGFAVHKQVWIANGGWTSAPWNP